MSAPKNKYNHKGISVCEWDGGSFTVEKRYKPKDSAEWKVTKTYFRNELEELAKLIQQALANSAVEPKKQAPQPVAFKDEDLPF